MPLERDEILVTGLEKYLELYQHSVILTMTASSAFFLLSLRLGDETKAPIQVLGTQMSLPVAWFTALALFVLLGGFTLSTLNRMTMIVKKFEEPRLPTELHEAVMLYPSLATSQNSLYRVGSIVFCPLTVATALIIEMKRESTGSLSSHSLWGILMFCVLIFGIYGGIVKQVWRPFGSRRDNPEPAAK